MAPPKLLTFDQTKELLNQIDQRKALLWADFDAKKETTVTHQDISEEWKTLWKWCIDQGYPFVTDAKTGEYRNSSFLKEWWSRYKSRAQKRVDERKKTGSGHDGDNAQLDLDNIYVTIIGKYSGANVGLEDSDNYYDEVEAKKRKKKDGDDDDTSAAAAALVANDTTVISNDQFDSNLFDEDDVLLHNSDPMVAAASAKPTPGPSRPVLDVNKERQFSCFIGAKRGGKVFRPPSQATNLPKKKLNEKKTLKETVQSYENKENEEVMEISYSELSLQDRLNLAQLEYLTEEAKLSRLRQQREKLEIEKLTIELTNK